MDLLQDKSAGLQGNACEVGAQKRGGKELTECSPILCRVIRVSQSFRRQRSDRAQSSARLALAAWWRRLLRFPACYPESRCVFTNYFSRLWPVSLFPAVTRPISQRRSPTARRSR